MALIRHRITSRVLVQANSGAFLLLLTHWDPNSGLKPRWVIPGGGIEADEPPRLAASRELFEETGLLIPEDEFDAQRAEIAFRQDWANGDHETGIAHVFHHRVENQFEISKNNWTVDEHRDILDVRWWLLEDLIVSGEAVGPPGLIELMREVGL